jgi:hypothetical protein
VLNNVIGVHKIQDLSSKYKTLQDDFLCICFYDLNVGYWLILSKDNLELLKDRDNELEKLDQEIASLRNDLDDRFVFA